MREWFISLSPNTIRFIMWSITMIIIVGAVVFMHFFADPFMALLLACGLIAVFFWRIIQLVTGALDD